MNRQAKSVGISLAPGYASENSWRSNNFNICKKNQMRMLRSLGFIEVCAKLRPDGAVPL